MRSLRAQTSGTKVLRHRDLSKRHTRRRARAKIARRAIGHRAAEVLSLGRIETSIRATLDLVSLGDIVNFDRLSQLTTPVQIWLHHIDVAILY